LAARQPRRTQAQRRAETIDALLRAAVDVIADRGFAGATLQDIADRAGASKGGMHHHFRAKYDLAPAVAARCIEEIRSFLAPALASDLAPTERLRRAARSFADAQLAREKHIEALTDLALATRHDPDLSTRLAPTFRKLERDAATSLDALLATAGLRTRVPSVSIIRALMLLAAATATGRPLLGDDATATQLTAETLLFSFVTV
jgi:AcrR family transcriptional regulator